MDRDEINIMNHSFGILDRRRTAIIHDEATEKLRERVRTIREKSVENLPQLLKIAVEKLQENDIEVVLAEDESHAVDAIYRLVGDEFMVAKSKSNTAGEIHLTEHLEKRGIQVVETDLGDRIVQLDPDSRSTHPIGPASHLDIPRIADIVSRSMGVKVEADPRAIIDQVKSEILEKLTQCRVGITGANSVAAHDGSLVMVHNEGNISLLAMMDMHIILVGIDKLVETVEDAVSVVKLETIYATGKKTPAYMNVISSPSKTADIEQVLLKGMYGASRVVAVLLDNGRSRAQKYAPESLWCIGCGACIVNCPVYNVLGPDFGYRRHLGGRGVILSQYIEGYEASYRSGLFFCTLCSLCTLECPLEIAASDMMEKLRKESVRNGNSPQRHFGIKNNIKKRRSPFSQRI